MTRTLDIYTLENAAKFYADEFRKFDYYDPRVPDKLIGGRNFVLQNFHDFAFKDEFEWLVKKVESLLDKSELVMWRRGAADVFEPRDDAVLEELLLEKLAINPSGQHVPGAVGSTEIGRRIVGKTTVAREKRVPQTLSDKLLGRPGLLLEVRYLPKKEYWPVYAGELEERAAGSDAVDPLPEGAQRFSFLPSEVYALNPRISNEAAIAACDAIVDRLDEGTTAAEIRGRTGAQPADPDSVETGTLLFTLVMSDPAFGAASDAAPGGRATASAITDDSSADATGTLGYCRCAATGTGLDDHIDGEAGTAGADFNFNTVSIVTGATVSMTSFTVTVPES